MPGGSPVAVRSGSKLVAGVVGLTLTALGVGTIYLPFVADRDKLRGMSEENEASALERFEYERAIREMSMNRNDPTSSAFPPPPTQSSRAGYSVQQQQTPAPPLSNNMWKRLNQAARSSTSSKPSSGQE